MRGLAWLCCCTNWELGGSCAALVLTSLKLYVVSATDPWSNIPWYPTDLTCTIKIVGWSIEMQGAITQLTQLNIPPCQVGFGLVTLHVVICYMLYVHGLYCIVQFESILAVATSSDNSPSQSEAFEKDFLIISERLWHCFFCMRI